VILRDPLLVYKRIRWNKWISGLETPHFRTGDCRDRAQARHETTRMFFFSLYNIKM